MIDFFKEVRSVFQKIYFDIMLVSLLPVFLISFSMVPFGAQASAVAADTTALECVACPMVLPECDKKCKDCKVIPQTCKQCSQAVCQDGTINLSSSSSSSSASSSSATPSSSSMSSANPTPSSNVQVSF